MVLTAHRALSSAGGIPFVAVVRGLRFAAAIRLGFEARLRRTGPTSSRVAKDHAVLPSAAACPVRPVRAAEDWRKPQQRSVSRHLATARPRALRARRCPRPPHPIPTFRDDGQRPSCGMRRRGCRDDLREKRESAYYFCEADWTRQITLNRLSKSAFTSDRMAAAGLTHRDRAFREAGDGCADRGAKTQLSARLPQLPRYPSVAEPR